MKTILVYADWLGLPDIFKIGILRTELTRGQEIFSFEYDSDWLSSGFAQAIDPDLRLFSGPQYLSDTKPNFGLFLDSSPDRWGRLLMQRREALASRQSGGGLNQLRESDYLLGVHDGTRIGALRFKLEEEGPFLASNELIKAPPFTSIRELQEASLQLEQSDFFEQSDAHKWLMLLLAPGSSLGGARPKASVQDPAGNLWIAKFPSKSDNRDSGAWELVANQMASELDIQVAESMAKRYSGMHHTYLSKRFDRSKLTERIHFASAMTLLGYKDGYDHVEGGSYLELVELIERYGARPTADIRELWKRIVYSVAISNTDDHLRNHGFLLTENGWVLSPAYDINPTEKGVGLSLNISEYDNSLDFGLCLSVAEYFRWEEKLAIEFIRKTIEVVSKWRKRAIKMKISNTEQVMMESAFSLQNKGSGF
jgi:serine/threonine-protein kinase HipA